MATEDPFAWRDSRKYPEAGLLMFVRCEVDTTAQHVATWCEGDYGARTVSWRIRDPNATGDDYPFLRDQMGFLSMMGRVVDAGPFVVVAAQLAFPDPDTWPILRAPFWVRPPIPNGQNVIEVILSELAPPYQARTTVTFKAWLINLEVIEYLSKTLDGFLDDYPTRRKSHYELYPWNWHETKDSPLWGEPINEAANRLIEKLEARGFEQRDKEGPRLDMMAAEAMLKRWDPADVQKIIEMSKRRVPVFQIAAEVFSSEASVKRVRDAATVTGRLAIKRRRRPSRGKAQRELPELS